MTSNDELFDTFERELLRQQELVEQTDDVLEAAEELYAPAALGSARSQRSTPFPSLGALFDNIKPDRLVTYPIWFLINAFIFGAIAILTVLTLLFGTALLLIVASIIDSFIGVPLAKIGAVAIGVLAGLGSLTQLFGSFLRRISTCPW